MQALKSCQPGDCAIQMPASTIEELQRSINWSAPDAYAQVNQFLQKAALARVLAYQSGGNQVLGVYNDHPDPTLVAQQFAYMLSYLKVLPERLPDFYRYLLSYPDAEPANVENMFYWSRVNFGLKPTLRVVQMVSMRGKPGDDLAFVIASRLLPDRGHGVRASRPNRRQRNHHASRGRGPLGLKSRRPARRDQK